MLQVFNETAWHCQDIFGRGNLASAEIAVS
jgi:hypothetical protein